MKQNSCGECTCGPMWDGRDPVTKEDVSWVVVEAIRVLGDPVTRTTLDEALAEYGVHSKRSGRDKTTVDNALVEWSADHGGWHIGVNAGDVEPTYFFVHVPTRRRWFSRRRSA